MKVKKRRLVRRIRVGKRILVVQKRVKDRIAAEAAGYLAKHERVYVSELRTIVRGGWESVVQTLETLGYRDAKDENGKSYWSLEGWKPAEPKPPLDPDFERRIDLFREKMRLERLERLARQRGKDV